MSGLLGEFVTFLKTEKKWWLVPMLVVIGLIAVFVVIATLFPQTVPFIYPV